MHHQQLHLNNTELHVVTQGEGPLIIMVHGFPGLAYSWRKQMGVLEDAGFKAVALDTRGYGRSQRFSSPEHYAVDEQISDLLALLEHFNEKKAVFIGHDFGANLVWQLAVRHPEKVHAVVSVAVPFGMDLAGGAGMKPSDMFAMIAENHFFHMHYFQQVGPAEQELGADPKHFLTKLFWALSGEGNLLNWENFPSEGTGYLDVLEKAPQFPWHWLTEQDMNHYVAEYCYDCENKPDMIFAGGLNAYRAMDITWQQSRDYAELNVEVPAMFITGSEDPVMKLADDAALDVMRARVTDLRVLQIVEGSGHFVQQENPTAFNKSLLEFLGSLDVLTAQRRNKGTGN